MSILNERLRAIDLENKLIDYDSGTNPVYVGSAAPGTATDAAGWNICKITYDGNDNPTSIYWANANIGNALIWDNRATYTYTATGAA